jgi:hypothetical protein
MVRISSRRNQQKKKPMEINPHSTDQSSSSSSKILHVVRQALLNAAEENSLPFHTFDMNNNNNKSRQRNGNSIKKKKLSRKTKTNRRRK